MKSYNQFIQGDYKSIHQRDQEIKQSIKDNLPDEDVLKKLSYDGMIRKLKRYYDIEKKEELIKGLLSNPTHLENIFVPPLRGSRPKPKPQNKSSSIRKTQTISKTDR